MEKDIEANPRGIRGLQVTSRTGGTSERFTQKQAKRQLQQQLLEQNKVGSGVEDQKSYSRLNARARRDRLREEDEIPDVASNTFSQMLKKNADTPGFPYMILLLAGAKELTDGLDFLIIGVIYTTIMAIPTSITLFFWTRIHTRSYGGNSEAFTRAMGYYIPAMTIEILPLIKILPAAVLFVLVIHYQEVSRAKRALK